MLDTFYYIMIKDYIAATIKDSEVNHPSKFIRYLMFVVSTSFINYNCYCIRYVVIMVYIICPNMLGIFNLERKLQLSKMIKQQILHT